MSASEKGTFTIRFAAVCFILSAALELSSPTSGVLLARAIREGALAVAYHAAWAALFVAIGIGLWAAKPWGLKVLLAATILYTLDKAQMLDRASLDVFLRCRVGGIEESVQPLVKDLMSQTEVNDLVERAVGAASALIVAGWWAFALYVCLRRGHFRRRTPAPAGPPTPGAPAAG